MKKQNYKQSKIKAKKIYSKIGRVPSPALSGEHVSFTSRGFTHLVRKGRNPRPRREQQKRFALIPLRGFFDMPVINYYVDRD